MTHVTLSQLTGYALVLQVLKIDRTATGHAHHVANIILGAAEHHPSLVDAEHLIGDLVEVARDMTAHEDRVDRFAVRAFNRHKVAQQIEHLIARHRVQARRRLIQNEQARLMRQCARQAQLHTHTARKVLDRLGAVELEAPEHTLEHIRVPGAIRARHEAAHLANRKMRGQRHRVEYHAHLLAHLRRLARCAGAHRHA